MKAIRQDRDQDRRMLSSGYDTATTIMNSQMLTVVLYNTELINIQT